MADIVLATLNAKYPHASLGLRYLLANLKELAGRAALAEFDINQRPLDVVEALLRLQPRIVGLGVYIWNAAQTHAVVAALKRVRPELLVILGGPEVSYEVEHQAVVQLADCVIAGEADLRFAEVCRQMLAGQTPEQKVLPAALPDLQQVALPYELYDDRDLAHRVVYVEASRGCPFRCEFCLSSLDVPVRQFPLELFLAAMERLLRRGLKRFKFVDRTFNLDLAVGRQVLEFFLERYEPGLFLHFEMVPDRLPAALREPIARFPPGALQFELGVQTFNPAVAANISRRQDYPRLEENLRYLRQHTGVHVHADLIVGLPGETVASLAAGFDRLVALRPQEIQVGILKRLRGTPIVRHDTAWQMVYSPTPPYELLCNKLIDFATMQRLRRFARYWDLVANSGNFLETVGLLWANAPGSAANAGQAPPRQAGARPSEAQPFPEDWAPGPFAAFLRFSDWLHALEGRQHGIALERLAEQLFVYLTAELGFPQAQVAAALGQDFRHAGREDQPAFLRRLAAGAMARPVGRGRKEPRRRQAKHLAHLGRENELHPGTR